MIWHKDMDIAVPVLNPSAIPLGVSFAGSRAGSLAFYSVLLANLVDQLRRYAMIQSLAQ